MMWVRIDNRLIHGQVIETWLPHTRAHNLIVANDAMATDDLQQQIASLAIPSRISVSFIKVEDLVGFLQSSNISLQDSLFLVQNCKDAKRILESGLAFETLNVGNIHYAPGKKQICSHVALSDEDESCLRFFMKKAVELDFRCVPNDPIQLKDW